MATLDVQNCNYNGLADIVYSNASATGDEFVNDGRSFLLIKNDDVASHNITITSQEKCSQGFSHDVKLSVASNDSAIMGAFYKPRFNDANGKIQITYDDVTSLSIAVISN